MKAVIKRAKREGAYNLTLSEMTEGELLALQHALSAYSERSAVGNDVYCAVRNGVQRYNDAPLGGPRDVPKALMDRFKA